LIVTHEIMANNKSKFIFHSFGSDTLSEFNHIAQISYLRSYLDELEATTIVEEANYFDRDYLSEFSAFYSVSSKGYPNICRRLHFFSGNRFNRRLLKSAAAGHQTAFKRLKKDYLGFIVIRPIPAAPLGRTVVRWYADVERNKSTPRVVNPSRKYFVHLAGIQLSVTGLAWQQQDTGVGACATVGLWTMFHSSAFDDHHAIPTTADITRAAHRRASLGARMFPSTGLTIHQICEAVKEQYLSPIITEGDIQDENGNVVGFSRERFSATCASFIRSGYPVLIIGQLGVRGGHAICSVGFRSCAPDPVTIGEVCLQDGGIEYLYIHDDNIGPNVRLKISTEEIASNGSLIDVTSLKTDAPPSRSQTPRIKRDEINYDSIIPTQLLVAVHNDLRTSPDKLHISGLKSAYVIASVLKTLAQNSRVNGFGLTLSTRFVKLAAFMTTELENTLSASPKILGKVRFSLSEDVPPMSLHIGVVRIGLDDATPLVDIIYDTTDSDRNHPVFAHIAYSSFIKPVIEKLERIGLVEFGVCVEAY